MTVFLALCILAMDLLVYTLFRRMYRDKRGTVARKIAAEREALKCGEMQPSVHGAGPETQARLRKVRARMGMGATRVVVARGAYRARMA